MDNCNFIDNHLFSDHVPLRLVIHISVDYITVTSRPFSVSKLGIKRRNKHLINNSLFASLQSAYRDKHSTETALIKVQNYIVSALDAGSSAILMMLDLSAAFDTIDHDILLSRLCNVYWQCT